MKQLIKGQKNSIIFWNVMFLLLYVSTLLINFQTFVILFWCIGSLITLIYLMFNLENTNSVSNLKHQYWMLLIPVYWLVLTVFVIIRLLVWLHENIIKKFNDYLN